MNPQLRSYRAWLTLILKEKKSTNARYSLRAFARDLGLPPAHLSQVLKNNGGISPRVAKQITQRLAMSESETEWFCLLVRAEDSRSKKDRIEAQQKMNQLLLGIAPDDSTFRNNLSYSLPRTHVSEFWKNLLSHIDTHMRAESEKLIVGKSSSDLHRVDICIELVPQSPLLDKNA